MVPPVKIIHGLHGQHHLRVAPRHSLAAVDPQPQLAAAGDHFLEHLVDRVFVLAGPFGDDLQQLVAVPAEEYVVKAELFTALPNKSFKEKELTPT